MDGDGLALHSWRACASGLLQNSEVALAEAFGAGLKRQPTWRRPLLLRQGAREPLREPMRSNYWLWATSKQLRSQLGHSRDRYDVPR